MERERRLSGSPPSFAESPLAAVWERASDGHALTAGNIGCIREARREAEGRHLRLRPGKRTSEEADGGPEGFWAVVFE